MPGRGKDERISVVSQNGKGRPRKARVMQSVPPSVHCAAGKSQAAAESHDRILSKAGVPVYWIVCILPFRKGAGREKEDQEREKAHSIGHRGPVAMINAPRPMHHPAFDFKSGDFLQKGIGFLVQLEGQLVQGGVRCRKNPSNSWTLGPRSGRGHFPWCTRSKLRRAFRMASRWV